MNAQVCSSLDQTEGERKAFSFGVSMLVGEGCWDVGGGGHSPRLPPRALGCSKRQKSFSFCEIQNNPKRLLFIRPPYK